MWSPRRSRTRLPPPACTPRARSARARSGREPASRPPRPAGAERAAARCQTVPMTLVIGPPAPDFGLRVQPGRTVRLTDFGGTQNVALVFYPFAFSGTCTGELCELRDN